MVSTLTPKYCHTPSKTCFHSLAHTAERLSPPSPHPPSLFCYGGFHGQALLGNKQVGINHGRRQHIAPSPICTTSQHHPTHTTPQIQHLTPHEPVPPSEKHTIPNTYHRMPAQPIIPQTRPVWCSSNIPAFLIFFLMVWV